MFKGIVLLLIVSVQNFNLFSQLIEAGDDANERLDFEINRLKDPATGVIPVYARQKEMAFAATLPKPIRRASQPTWNSRGPWNVGGRTRAFAADIANNNHLLAGSTSGGMWYSNDAGKSWTPSAIESNQKSVSCIAQDTRINHRNTWYIGTGEAYGQSAGGTGAYYLGDGLYKSTDNGNTWQAITATTAGEPTSFTNNFQLVWNIAVNPAAHDSLDEIWVATYSGIYKSVNGGKNFTLIFSGQSYFTDIAITKSGVIYVTLSSDGSSKGIFRSSDGVNFTNITPTNFPSKFNRIVIGTSFSNENEVYFLANTPNAGKNTPNYLKEPEWNSFFKYAYLKNDGKDTNGIWKDISLNLPGSGGQFDKWQVQGSYDMVVKVKPDESNFVIIGGTNLYRSTTGFLDSTHTTFVGGYQHYSKLPVIASYPNHHPDQHVVFFGNNSNVLYSANDGGLFVTQNCKEDSIRWESLNNGYLTSMFYTVAIDHASKNDPIIIAGAQDNGSWFTNSNNSQKDWVQPRGGDGSYCAIADNKSKYFFSIQNAKMMMATVDANGNKIAFTRIDPIGLKKPKFINPYLLDPNNNNVMYCAGGKYLWRNNNLSQLPLNGSWDSISTNWVKWPDSIPLANKYISALAISKSPANRLYVGTDYRHIYKIDNANSGTPSFTQITGTALPGIMPTGNVSCIAVDPNNADNIIATFSNYGVQSVFYSSNAGTSWQRVGGNLEPSNGTGPSVRWASILPVTGGNIYFLATSVGVFACTWLNGDNTVWVRQGSGLLDNAVCDMLDTRISDGLVVVATHSHGIFSSNYTNVSDVVSNKELVRAPFSIGPNPTKTEIYINGKLNSTCKLEILDELGRNIKSVSAAEIQHKKIQLTGMKNGIYYIHYSKGEEQYSIQFIINN